MKKLLVLLGIISFLPVYGYILDSETSDIDVLREQGYSKSALEVIDAVKYRNTGKNRTYRRYYEKKDHRYLGKVYHNIKLFIDPAQDDAIFGEHQINFTNTWNGDNTKYSSDRKPAYQVDNL